MTDKEKALQWLQSNADVLNLSEVARRINIDVSNLRKAIKGEPDTHGTTLGIPERCVDAVVELQKQISIGTIKKRKA